MTVVLITGGDDPLVAEAVRDAVNRALGGEDRSLAVEVLTEEDYRVDHDFEIACLVDAAQTAPFLTTCRVVVGRHVGRFGRAEAVVPLVAYLEAPLPTTSLVLVWERGVEPAQQRLGPVPKILTEAVEATTEAANTAADALSEAAEDVADAAAEAGEDAMNAGKQIAEDATQAANDTAEGNAEVSTSAEADAMAASDAEASDAASTTQAGTAPAADPQAEADAAAVQEEEAAAVAATDAQASADAGAAADTEVQADVTADADTPEQLTTVDGFDLEKVQTMIDTSDLPATQKTLLKQGLVTAGENPDALRAILARIREALAL